MSKDKSKFEIKIVNCDFSRKGNIQALLYLTVCISFYLQKCDNFPGLLCLKLQLCFITVATCNPPLTAPLHGDVFCSDVNFLGSLCAFFCSPSHQLVGQSLSECDYIADVLSWSNPVPACASKYDNKFQELPIFNSHIMPTSIFYCHIFPPVIGKPSGYAWNISNCLHNAFQPQACNQVG